MHISVDTFTEAIKKSWHRESSGDPELRSDENPSYRQCLVTALLANEFLLLPVFAEKITSDRNRTGYHYFNKDNANVPLRFCEEQFAYEKIVSRKKERPLNKEKIDFLLERHPEVKSRYELLKKKFQSELEKIIR